MRNIEYNTGKKCKTGKSPTPEDKIPIVRWPGSPSQRTIESCVRQGNLTLGCRTFPCLALFASVWFYFSLLSAVFSFVFVYVLLADDHVNNVSYFPFMSIKKVYCVLREGYYVIIWLMVRICVFIKDWKLIYSELFILKGKSMENWGDSWHKLYSMHLPVKRMWFFFVLH